MNPIPVAILCGGKGKRLRPHTLSIPKALIPVHGKPILEYILRMYARKGFHRFLICTGYKSELIEEFCSSLAMPCTMYLSNSGESASMLKRIADLAPQVEDNVIVSYGDTLTDIDLNLMMAEHRQSAAAVTIASADIRCPFGLVEDNTDGELVSLVEKPVMRYYIGHAIFSKCAFPAMTPALCALPDGEGLIAFYRHLIPSRKIHVYRHLGFQITFNTEGELADAEKQLKGFYTVKEE